MGEKEACGPAGDDAWQAVTRLVHRGETVDPAVRPAVAPIYQTSVFAFPGLEALERYYNQGEGYLYSRYGNPSVRALEEAAADLDGCQDAVATSSGMAALVVGILAVARGGGHVIGCGDLYGATQALLSQAESFGFTATVVPSADPQAVAAAVTPETRLVVAELVTNPTIRVCDVAGLAEVAHAAGARLLVDATFATPYHCRPAELGADLVMHSATKFYGGHSDVTAGVLCGRRGLIEAARQLAILLGTTLAPFEAWLCLRGLKTLPLRMAHQSAQALRVAEALSRHPAVASVSYPGLPSHPDHELARAILRRGFGPMLAFTVRGGAAAADRFLRALRLIRFEPSFGGVTTTVSHTARTSHRHLEPEERERRGIGEGLIRLSVGCEDLADILADLDQALAAAGA
jgi:cystathionine beta-lyase/cystathionine gamma-synthase